MSNGEVSSEDAGRKVLGCFLFVGGMLLFVVLASVLSGYFFYRNFGPRFEMARDEIEPVGRRFIRALDNEAYADAYACLSEKARAAWPQQAFADLAQEIHAKLGRINNLGVDAQRLTVAVVEAKSIDALSSVPMDFICFFDGGEGTFDLSFEKEEGRWKVSSIRFEVKGNRRKPGWVREAPRDTVDAADASAK